MFFHTHKETNDGGSVKHRPANSFHATDQYSVAAMRQESKCRNKGTDHLLESTGWEATLPPKFYLLRVKHHLHLLVYKLGVLELIRSLAENKNAQFVLVTYEGFLFPSIKTCIETSHA